MKSIKRQYPSGIAISQEKPKWKSPISEGNLSENTPLGEYFPKLSSQFMEDLGFRQGEFPERFLWTFMVIMKRNIRKSCGFPTL